MNKNKIWRIAWRIVHWFIIVNFIVEIAYCGFQVFGVLGGGPLFGAALDMDIDLFLKRRLYAIETWIAIAGLAIYIAITEILPRQKKEMATASRVTESP
ncbi:MAG: hypothetical protein Q6373_010295 [Candidatus Sigynarchaeota archaeon]